MQEIETTNLQSPALLARLMTGGLTPGAGLGQGGGFMDLILQLIAQTEDPDGNGDALAQLMENIGQPGAVKKNSSDDALMQLLGGMMAAESMASMPSMLGDLPVSDEAVRMVQTLMGVSEGEARQLLGAQDPVQAARPNEAGAQQGQEKAFEVLEVPEQAVQGKQESGSDSEALFWSGRFQSSVSQAQKLMQGSGKDETDAAKVDVETLQGDVNANRFTPVRTAAQSELPEPDAKDVTEQVRTGILQNLGRGRSEFVVKLKPDGLGEITVHMAENGGKLALSIVASSEQTARLLNAELSGLRESLRPWNAEVHEVATQQQAQHYSDQQAAYDQNSHTPQQQHHAQAQARESFEEFLSGGAGQEENVPAGVYV